MNAQERLDDLLTTEWVPTDKAVLFADITALVGLEATALVVGTMKAASASNPLMDTIIIAMSTNGLSLSSPDRQAVIDQLALAGGWPDAVRDAVKALGGEQKPKWMGAGYEIEPTIESIQAEMNLAAGQSALDAIETRCNAAMEAARAEFIAGRFDGITAAAEGAWA
jgi:hypothetical protein